MGVAQPMPAGTRGDVANTGPMVEVHTRLVAWWLVCSWRALELAEAVRVVADLDSPLTAAMLSRPLLQTAAAAYDDARLLHSTC